MSSQDRLSDKRMNYYRTLYANSSQPKTVDELKDKHLVIYGEQGLGDQIMYLRYLPLLLEKAIKVTIHAAKSLERLVEHLGAEFLGKDEQELPPHDHHLLSFDLPFFFGVIPGDPYIFIPEKEELTGFNVGIAWEGSTVHAYSKTRNCPLKYFRPLPGNLIWLQSTANDKSLLEGAEGMNINGCNPIDFYDTAKVINAVDAVVSVDTSVLHLAGAMGKRSFGILPTTDYDPRWKIANWYPCMRMMYGDYALSLRLIGGLLSK